MGESNRILLKNYIDNLLVEAEKIIQGVEKPLTVRTLGELLNYFDSIMKTITDDTEYLSLLLHMNKYVFDILNGIRIHLKTLNDILEGDIDIRNISFVLEFEEAKFETIHHTVLKLGEMVKKIDDAELKDKIFKLTNNCLNALCVFTKAGFEKKIFDAEKYLNFVENTLTELKKLIDSH